MTIPPVVTACSSRDVVPCRRAIYGDLTVREEFSLKEFGLRIAVHEWRAMSERRSKQHGKVNVPGRSVAGDGHSIRPNGWDPTPWHRSLYCGVYMRNCNYE